jgi:hypothetical protein
MNQTQTKKSAAKPTAVPALANPQRIAAAVHQVLDRTPALGDVDLADEVWLVLTPDGKTPGATFRDGEEAIRAQINSVRLVRRNRQRRTPAPSRGRELPLPPATPGEQTRFANAKQLIAAACAKHPTRPASRVTAPELDIDIDIDIDGLLRTA